MRETISYPIPADGSKAKVDHEIAEPYSVHTLQDMKIVYKKGQCYHESAKHHHLLGYVQDRY